MRRLARAALVLVVAGGLGWGCAGKVRENNWQAYEPPGGWANYKPPKRDYYPSAANVTAFGITPQISTLSTSPYGAILPATGH
jgi:hypothetical protein